MLGGSPGDTADTVAVKVTGTPTMKVVPKVGVAVKLMLVAA
jgi:hypothetical protein